jgi:hypothetical protein
MKLHLTDRFCQHAKPTNLKPIISMKRFESSLCDSGHEDMDVSMALLDAG